MARRCAYLVFKGKSWILQWDKNYLKKLKMTFGAETYANIVLEYTKRCGRARFMLSKKSSFCLFSWENKDFRFFRLQWSSIVLSKIENPGFPMKM